MSLSRTYVYDITNFITNNNEIVVFDGTENHKIAKTILWNQPILSANIIELHLTPYGSTTSKVWRGFAGETQINEEKYSKIVLKLLPLQPEESDEEIETAEPPTLVGIIAPDEYYNKVIAIKENEYFFFDKIDVKEMTINSNGTLVNQDQEIYQILGVIGPFDPTGLMTTAPNTSSVEDLSISADGTISWIEEEYFGEEPEELTQQEIFEQNTRLELFTIPAGTAFSDVVDSSKVEEYVELFYTLERSEDGDFEDGGNIITIENLGSFEAQEYWSAAIPGKAIYPNAVIEKGNNVRVDVYLRYWIGDKPEGV